MLKKPGIGIENNTLRRLKRILFAIAGITGLLILISVALFLFADINAYKPRLERTASEALGMEVQIGGRLGIGLSPGVHVRLEAVRVRNRGVEIASAKEAGLQIALLPLLHREVRVTEIRLQSPRISLKRGHDGTFNFGRREEAGGTLPAVALDHLSLSDGSFLYEDEQSGGEFKAENFNLDVRSLRIAGGDNAKLLKNLSFTAEFAGREIRTKDIAFSDVKFTGKGKDGIIALNPVTMRLFGGRGSGRIGADFSGPVPRYFVRSSLAKFRIEEYFKTLSAKKVAEGAMDFSATLAMQGNTAKELTRSAEGDASLRGENLTLYGYDLDREFDRFESSQSFNLVDVGAFFFAGPIGLAVTKGYTFASILQ
ncbi:MAG: AsmA family protein [Syntrophales bacterium]